MINSFLIIFVHKIIIITFVVSGIIAVVSKWIDNISKALVLFEMFDVQLCKNADDLAIVGTFSRRHVLCIYDLYTVFIICIMSMLLFTLFSVIREVFSTN